MFTTDHASDSAAFDVKNLDFRVPVPVDRPHIILLHMFRIEMKRIIFFCITDCLPTAGINFYF